MKRMHFHTMKKNRRTARRFAAALLATLLALLTLAGCGTAQTTSVSADAGADSDSGLSIVATIFPEYDWVRALLGDNPADAEVTLLLDNGVDLHSYQPTAQDILRIASCDLFLYVGGESDAWVDDALREAANEDRIVIDLLDVLGDAAKEEELVEGMEAEEEEDAGEEPALDEHVWLSLRNAAQCVQSIEEALEALDPSHAETYRANLAAYQAQLADLDARYEDAVAKAAHDTLLFADRFPFRYLTEDYGLSYYAAFQGCSAESEAGFDTIAFLAQKADELALPAVLTIEGSDHRLAETVVETSQSRPAVLTMDSMQSTTQQDVAQGATYLTLIEKNLDVLQEALK